MSNQIIFGTSVLNNVPPATQNPIISLPGQALNEQDCFQLNEDTLSKHILLLGGSGCGKTNAFLFVLRELRSRMNSNDITIIFDTKGEFYDMFSRPGDYVIGNSSRFRSMSHTWNIFDEIFADGTDKVAIRMNARELAASLFLDRISETQPFFGNAAKDIFMAVLLHFIRMAESNPSEWKNRLNNKDLTQAFRAYQSADFVKILNHYSDLRNMVSYIGDGRSNQALGVFGELNSMLSEYFVGVLADHNPEKNISMRNAVREKGGKAIFIEYDLSLGESLTPVYRLLVDQALKEALGRSENSGHVYLIADEFKLLPKLQHIDDALNFGRGLGVRAMAGIQSIDQLYDIYGEDKGAVLASGFGSIFAFHTNDFSSREYITKRFGTNIMVYDYVNAQKNTAVTNERDGNTVEEWDQTQLGVGQAVIGLGHDEPFLFQFDEYK